MRRRLVWRVGNTVINAPWEQPSKQRALGAAGIILQRGEEEEKVGQAWVDGAGAMLA